MVPQDDSQQMPSSPLVNDHDHSLTASNDEPSQESIDLPSNHSHDASTPPSSPNQSIEPCPTSHPNISSTPSTASKQSFLLTPPDSVSKAIPLLPHIRSHSLSQSLGGIPEAEKDDSGRTRSKSSGGAISASIADRCSISLRPVKELNLDVDGQSSHDSDDEEYQIIQRSDANHHSQQLPTDSTRSNHKSPIFLPRQSYSSPDPLYNPNNTTNVYINGLPPFFTHEQLSRLAAEFGRVLSCRVFHRFNQIKPSGAGQQEGSTYAFVLYETIDDARRCIISLRKYSDLHPSFARTQRLPGARAPQPITAEGLLDKTRPAYRGSPDRKEVQYPTVDARPPITPNVRISDEVNILIQGLPSSATEKTVQSLIQPHVPVNVRLIPIGTEARKESRQIAYVRFSSRIAADETIQKLHDRPVIGWTADGDTRVTLQVIEINPIEQQAVTQYMMRTVPATDAFGVHQQVVGPNVVMSSFPSVSAYDHSAGMKALGFQLTDPLQQGHAISSGYLPFNTSSSHPYSFTPPLYQQSGQTPLRQLPAFTPPSFGATEYGQFLPVPSGEIEAYPPGAGHSGGATIPPLHTEQLRHLQLTTAIPFLPHERSASSLVLSSQSMSRSMQQQATSSLIGSSAGSGKSPLQQRKVSAPPTMTGAQTPAVGHIVVPSTPARTRVIHSTSPNRSTPGSPYSPLNHAKQGVPQDEHRNRVSTAHLQVGAQAIPVRITETHQQSHYQQHHAVLQDRGSNRRAQLAQLGRNPHQLTHSIDHQTARTRPRVFSVPAGNQSDVAVWDTPSLTGKDMEPQPLHGSSRLPTSHQETLIQDGESDPLATVSSAETTGPKIGGSRLNVGSNTADIPKRTIAMNGKAKGPKRTGSSSR